MASGFSFELDTRQLDRNLSEFGRRAPALVAATLNRTANKVRTFMKREISKDIGLPVGQVDKSMSVRNASPGEPRAVLTVTGKRIPLIQFGARGPEPSRGRGGGVSYKLAGGRGRHPNAFIATMPGGHRGVFVRSPSRSTRRGSPPSRSGLPIRELFGPSIVSAFRKHVEKARVLAQDELVKEIRRLLARKDLAQINSGAGG